MADRTIQDALRGDTDLYTERRLPQPRELVYGAFTDPAKLERWWGPHGFTNRSRACDPRPGGEWDVTLVGPDGAEHANLYRFVEMVAPERVVMDHLSGHWFRLTVELHDEAGGTRVTWRQTFGSRQERDQIAEYCVPGNEGNLDRLGALLAGQPG